MESFINSLNDLGSQIPFHAETLLAYLDESLTDCNIKNSNLRIVRVGRHLMATINDKYILRIRLFPRKEKNKHNRSVDEILKSHKDRHLNEIETIQKLFKMFEKSYTGTNPIPELVHTGQIGDSIVSIYKNIKGKRLDISLVNPVKTAKNLADIMSLFHSYSKPYSGSKQIDIQYYKFLVSRKKELDKFPCCHVIVKDLLGNFILNHFQRFSRGANTKRILNHGRVGILHHILVDGDEVKGLIDWEHCIWGLSGFKDFETIYKHLIVDARNLANNDYYEKAIVFWDNLIQNYICPVKNRFLEKHEIAYIEFVGFLNSYRRKLKLFNSGYKKELNNLKMNLMVERLSNRMNRGDVWKYSTI